MPETQNTASSPSGRETPTKDFFVNLLDMRTQCQPSSGSDFVAEWTKVMNHDRFDFA